MTRTHEDILDELLVLQCQDGDRQALRTLIQRWQPRLTRLAWRLVGERESAADAAQEAWLAIVRSLRRLDDPARFRAWAYRIVANKCADRIRRRSVERAVETELQHATAAEAGDTAAGPDELERLHKALNDLSGQDRALLSLHYLDGMAITEMAETLAIPPGTVKSRLHYARSRLRAAMERVQI